MRAGDIDGHNRFGPIYADEPFLADDQLSYLGQPILAIAADDPAAAAAAKSAVVIETESSTPILTIEDALQQQSFHGPARRIARGDFAAAWQSARHKLEGTLQIGGQEQFYLESQAAIAFPDEGRRIVVHSSTQNPTEVQAVVAEILGLGQHEVVCVCKRMGGGFGGKETQSSIYAGAAALTALKTGRAARCVLTKDDDMKITGKRHPYLVFYKAAYDDEGQLLAVKFDFYSDGGAFADLSTSVLERTMLHCDNAYFIPNIEIRAQVCRTNFPPNTAFRGFGGPQGMAAIENVMQEIAIQRQCDALEVRRLNCYGRKRAKCDTVWSNCPRQSVATDLRSADADVGLFAQHGTRCSSLIVIPPRSSAAWR